VGWGWGGVGWSGAKPPCGVGWGEVGWDGGGGGGHFVTKVVGGGEGDRIVTKVVEVRGEGVHFVTKVFLGGRGFTLLQKLWRGWGSRCYKTCGGVGG
jgi:hypothetical protein